ncbi:MAG: hypothetical protein E7292_08975 [Lachnospiraceae bacterium]|nr:hypothetical protein [Lachnospiraceae bacterium]
MWNLIKAQKYQLKRDNGIVYIYLIAVAMVVFTIVDILDSYSMKELSGSYMGLCMGEIDFVVLGILVVLLTARISGWDYTDKTINYELMSGHSRSAVYWSRVMVSMIYYMVSCILIIAIPLLIFSALNGWGIRADMGGMLLRYGLALFPLFRLMCECILLTVLMRNCYLVMVIGFTVYQFSWVFATMAELFIEFEFTTQLASMNVLRLICLEKSHFEYINGEDVIVYKTSMEPDFLVGTIVVSLAVGIGCLLAGYLYFKKCDMD